MKYQRRSFTVPVSETVSAEEWENIFGTEEERKEKMARAIEKQKQEKEAELTRKLGVRRSSPSA